MFLNTFICDSKNRKPFLKYIPIFRTSINITYMWDKMYESTYISAVLKMLF